MSISSENTLFNWMVANIRTNASAIASMSHLFDGLRVYDTALEKLDLRQSAANLREAADALDKIASELKGTETAFPDTNEAPPQRCMHCGDEPEDCRCEII